MDDQFEVSFDHDYPVTKQLLRKIDAFIKSVGSTSTGLRSIRIVPPDEPPADTWLRNACPEFYEDLERFINAYLLLRSEDGFDWYYSQALLVMVFVRYGGRISWKEVAERFAIKGKPILRGSLKAEASRRRHCGGEPDGWKEIIDAVPALDR